MIRAENSRLPLRLSTRDLNPDLRPSALSTEPLHPFHPAPRRYAASGPLHIRVELLYQPIGFRWPHNLEAYKASEPQRFLHYYETDSSRTATTLAAAQPSR